MGMGMKTLWEWINGIIGAFWFARKQIHATDDTPASPPDWNPFLTAAVERERRAMIYRKLRTFLKMNPRPGHSPHALATIRKRMRRNARNIIRKRLQSRKGIA